jgi:predicted deacylase
MTDRVDALIAASGLSVPAGGRAQGFLPVDGFAQYSVPVAVLRGVRPGPVAVVIAGVHAGEYNGIEATRRVAADLDPRSLAGAVAFVPIANRAAFHARSHNGAPPDGQNLGRLFPGAPAGKALERVAHVITSKLIHHADALLDLHGADALEDLTDHLYIPPLQGAGTRPWSGWDLAEVYGIALVEELPLGKLAGSASHAGANAGIPSILPEAGAFGHVREEPMRTHYDGIVNVLKRVGILDGTPAPRVRARRIRHERMLSPATGLFYSKVKAGDIVSVGQIIGEITDYFGAVVATITAPAAGEIDFIKYSLATNKGDSIFHVAADV